MSERCEEKSEKRQNERGVQELAPALCDGKGGVVCTRDESANRRRGADNRGGLRTHAQRAGERGGKGVPIVVAKDNQTKAIVASFVPSKALDSYAVETVKKMVKRLGHRKIITRSDNEPAILALKEAVRE